MPADWTRDPQLLDHAVWTEAARYQRSMAHDGHLKRSMFTEGAALPYDGNAVTEQANWVWQGIDAILAQHGYHRDRLLYRNANPAPDEGLLLFFAHLGVIDVVLSHLLNISAPALWQGTFLAPSSVTILATEEREPGIAYFRAQAIGDTAHLLLGGEPVSSMGYFTDAFTG